ncbi:MAG: STAS domain-containing protein [Peptoniphilaceae bacterium]|nr:STAS domain-containing protein [Peptoniphilaceae bacterium]MDY3738525.1 STAS domain-containing protein [Peptoniphilaceae bacterium]
MFEKTLIEKDDTLEVIIKGDLDVYSIDSFKDFINDNIKNTKKNILFDFNDLNYIDSTGIGQFINIYKIQNEKNKNVKIINAKRNIKKIFEITDLLKLFGMDE